MQTFSLTNPLDMHIHLREGVLLETILPFSAENFISGVIMPNLKNPITTAKEAQDYRRQINALYPDFYPIMSLYITSKLNDKELENIKDAGFKILKLYPKGATTNSNQGVSEILDSTMLKILEIAQELELILSVHAESNGFSMDREYEFLKILETIARKYPHLKIIIEHMSDHRSIKLLQDYENIFATLTLHHITLDLDSLLGNGLSPHYFCKPILKTPYDREKLLELALNAHPKVSFGSDSAPHLLKHKIKDNASAGIFSAPYLLESLIELFEKHHSLQNLQNFVSNNAIKNYTLSFEKNKIFHFKKQPSIIPLEITTKDQQTIIPLHAGKNLSWSKI